LFDRSPMDNMADLEGSLNQNAATWQERVARFSVREPTEMATHQK
jgi:hypothetical protein